MLEKKELKDYGHKLVDRVGQLIAAEQGKPLVLYLEGGCYDTEHGVTEFARHSLISAMDIASNIIGAYKKKVKVILGIIINDLGVSCHDLNCSTSSPLQKENPLPGEVLGILQSYAIYKSDLFVIARETTLKNRGIRHLKKIRNAESDTHPGKSLLTENFTQSGLGVYYNFDGRKVLLAEIRETGWAIKCSLIMAQHYFDLYRLMYKRVPDAHTYMIVDISDKMEETKVTSGAEILLHLMLGGNSLPPQLIVENILFWNARGDKVTTRVTDSCDWQQNTAIKIFG
jgi:hypothetical protein